MKGNFYTFWLCLAILTLISYSGFSQQAGDLDSSFNPGTMATGEIRTTTLQPDGKIIIAGNLSGYSGAVMNDIVRLNANGSLDASFNPGMGANDDIGTTTLVPDGKIIIGGIFTSYSGTPRNRIARLNANGSLDASFNPGTGANNRVRTITLQPDGKIIIGGDFNSYNGITRSRIARLNADGSPDASFNPGTGANGRVYTTTLQSDGKIIIGGDFTSCNGTDRNRIARLNADGSLDASFNPGAGTNDRVHTTILQPDGKIIIVGDFISYNGTARNRIARLNADGSLDASFNPGTGPSSSILTTTLQLDGKIIIGGGFFIYNGTARNRIARLNADGSLDFGFHPQTGADNWVYTTNLQPDGKIIIGGDFNYYNGTTRNLIARIIGGPGCIRPSTPYISAGGSTFFCPGDSVTLTASIAPGYIWSNGDTTRSITVNTFGNYTVRAVAAGCTSFASEEISVRSSIFTPNITAGGPTTLCSGDSVTLTASLAPFYIWSNGATTRSITVNTSGNYTVRTVVAGCTSATSAAMVISIYNPNTVQPGDLDICFYPGMGANDRVHTTILQPDGKIIIGGDFTIVNSTSSVRIARLNANGSPDTSFNPGAGANGSVYTTTLQGDGKIIIGGEFTSYNGIRRRNIARLNANGSLDASFNPGIGADNTVYTTTLQGDGKIIIGGDFTSYNGTLRNRIARLNGDGSLDASFNSGSGSSRTVYTTTLQPDGKIIIGGDFSGYNGTLRNRIARLNANGSLDASFNPGTGADDIIFTTTLQPDGKIIIGGLFIFYNNISRNRIARLNADGSLDASFNSGTGANNIVNTTTLLPNGKIIIGGGFTMYNRIPRNRIGRLNADGSLDTSLNSGTGTDFWVRTTTLQADGKIIIGGDFTSYNGSFISRIARIFGGVGCTIPSTPTITAGGPTTFCNGGSVTLTASIAAGYLWSNGATTRSITVNASGNYTVRAIAAGCTSAASVATSVLNSTTTPTIVANGPTTFCSGGSVTLTASSAAGYLWSNGATTRSITVNTSGNYTVRAVAAGCTSAASAAIVISINHPNTVEPGELDFCFNPGTGANNTILTTALQPNGKIIIGGDFTSYNGTLSNRIVRLNADGSLDASFNPGTGANGSIRTTTLLPNGQFIIGGDFTSYNGISANRIVQLCADGCRDLCTPFGTGANNSIITSTLFPGDRIIIGGDFTSYNGTPRNRIALLNLDGSLDFSFSSGTGPNNQVSTITLQPNFKIIIGGGFTGYNGTLRNRIARLNPNGSLDASFNPGTGANDWVRTATLQSDGKIIIGGDFTSYNGIPSNRIARLNADGSLDASFNSGTGANNIIYTTTLQPDGKIIIGGDFTSYNGIPRNRIARLNADGSLDTSFNPGIGAGNTVRTTTLQPDGKIIMGGSFTSYNGTARNRIARIFGGAGCTTPSTPTISASGPTTFCNRGSVTLTASSAAGYLWSNGATTQSIEVSSRGVYTVQTVIAGGCTSLVSPEVVVSIDTTPSTPTITYTSDSVYSNVVADSLVWYKDSVVILGLSGTIIPIQGNGTYQARAFNGNCGSNLSAPVSIIIISAFGNSKSSVSLFPNPNSGSFTVEGLNIELKGITITTAVGKSIHTQRLTGNRQILNLNLPAGIYIAQVETEKGISTQKLVIE